MALSSEAVTYGALKKKRRRDDTRFVMWRDASIGNQNNVERLSHWPQRKMRRCGSLTEISKMNDQSHLGNDAAAAGAPAAVFIDGGKGGILLADDAAAAGSPTAVLVDGGRTTSSTFLEMVVKESIEGRMRRMRRPAIAYAFKEQQKDIDRDGQE
ncbi:hypothetical protein K438DRAFT_1755775 [Mycena galopus ATCC 62051]|nr:hypothetical protein K438DRAFT_1755775 [Mycena galopus ATCC 62051]